MSAQYTQVHNDYDELEMAARGVGSNQEQEKLHEFKPIDNQLEMEEDENTTSPSQRRPSNDFAHHDTLLRADSARQIVIEEQNLDEFFSQVYKYFYEKGFWNLLLSRLLKLFTVCFVIALSSIILVLVNWQDLLSCKQDACKKVNILKFPEEFTTFHIWVIVFESVFLLYWFTILVQYVFEVGTMLRVKSYFNKKLYISETDIQTITWHEVVEKFVQVQQENPISRVKQRLDEKDIVNLIMRKENYLIAFLNKNVLNLSLPFSKTPILTESLLWNLRLFISQMFDAEYRVKERLLKNPNELRWRFIYLGVVNFLAAPFLLVYLIVYLFFKYTAELRETGFVTVFDRRWTTFAKWRFREFNELQHVFEERMKKSVWPAKDYVRQFPTYYLSIIGRLVMFLASGFAAIIIIMTAVKSDLILYITILNQNLVWWLSVLMIIYFNAKSVVIDDNQVFDPNHEMDRVCELTHYYPRKWKGKGHTKSVRLQFCQLFQYTIVVVLYELASIVLTPFVLSFSIPQHVDKLAQFIDSVTVEEEGLGHVCGFATFALEKHGNPRYQPTATNQAEEEELKPVDNNGSAATASGTKKLSTSLHSSHGKMEQSLLSFAVHHPQWQPDKKAAEFISRVKQQGDLQQQQQQQVPVNNNSVMAAPSSFNQSVIRPLVSNQSMILPQSQIGLSMQNTSYGGMQQQQAMFQHPSMLESANRMFNMLESMQASQHK